MDVTALYKLVLVEAGACESPGFAVPAALVWRDLSAEHVSSPEPGQRLGTLQPL